MTCFLVLISVCWLLYELCHCHTVLSIRLQVEALFKQIYFWPESVSFHFRRKKALPYLRLGHLQPDYIALRHEILRPFPVAFKMNRLHTSEPIFKIN